MLLRVKVGLILALQLILGLSSATGLAAPPFGQPTASASSQTLATATWIVRDGPQSAIVYSVLAMKTVNDSEGAVTEVAVAKASCRYLREKLSDCEGDPAPIMRIPDDAFEFDPAMGDAHLRTKVGGMPVRTRWTGEGDLQPDARHKESVLCGSKFCPLVFAGLAVNREAIAKGRIGHQALTSRRSDFAALSTMYGSVLVHT